LAWNTGRIRAVGGIVRGDECAKRRHRRPLPRRPARTVSTSLPGFVTLSVLFALTATIAGIMIPMELGLQPMPATGEGSAPWLAPTNMGRMADVLAADLARLDPPSADRIAANLAALKQRLLSLKAEADTALSEADDLTAIALSPHFACPPRRRAERGPRRRDRKCRSPPRHPRQHRRRNG
jgi:hypothetical protein